MRFYVTMVAAAALFAACIPADENSSGTNTTVSVVDYFFSPKNDTVFAGVGDTANVTFTWITPSNGHIIVWDSAGAAGAADSAIPLPSGTDLVFEGSYKVNLVPATYWYHCSRHAFFDENNHRDTSGMVGILTVRPHSAAPGQSGIVGF
jgi:plastocyanin